MASSTLALAAVAAKIQNIGQLRAAMGAVASTLQQGYAKLDEITTVADVRDAARSLLDVVNGSAQKLYNIYNDDPTLQDEEISTYHAHIAGVVVGEANDALKAVEDAAKFDFWNIAAIVDEAISQVGAIAGATLKTVVNAAVAGSSAFLSAAGWSVIAVVAIIAAILYARYRIGEKVKSLL